MPTAQKRPKHPRKKKTFSASKAVKSNARDLIGTPPSTRLEPDKRKLVRREKKHKATLGELLVEE